MGVSAKGPKDKINQPQPLQALVVLNYELRIVMNTAAALLLGRREALFSNINLCSPTPAYKN